MMGAGVVLIAIGVLVAVLLNSTLGIIVTILGIVAVALSFSNAAPFGSRRTTIIERERRPVTRERETVRETEL